MGIIGSFLLSNFSLGFDKMISGTSAAKAANRNTCSSQRYK
jgi:hypothetical protein